MTIEEKLSYHEPHWLDVLRPHYDAYAFQGIRNQRLRYLVTIRMDLSTISDFGGILSALAPRTIFRHGVFSEISKESFAHPACALIKLTGTRALSVFSFFGGIYNIYYIA